MNPIHFGEGDPLEANPIRCGEGEPLEVNPIHFGEGDPLEANPIRCGEGEPLERDSHLLEGDSLERSRLLSLYRALGTNGLR